MVFICWVTIWQSQAGQGSVLLHCPQGNTYDCYSIKHSFLLSNHYYAWVVSLCVSEFLARSSTTLLPFTDSSLHVTFLFTRVSLRVLRPLKLVIQSCHWLILLSFLRFALQDSNSHQMLTFIATFLSCPVLSSYVCLSARHWWVLQILVPYVHLQNNISLTQNALTSLFINFLYDCRILIRKSIIYLSYTTQTLSYMQLSYSS